MQETQEQAAELRRHQDRGSRQRELTRRKQSITRQIAELQSSLEAHADEEEILMGEDTRRESESDANRLSIAARRGAVE